MDQKTQAYEDGDALACEALDRAFMHRVVILFNDLCVGGASAEARNAFVDGFRLARAAHDDMLVATDQAKLDALHAEIYKPLERAAENEQPKAGQVPASAAEVDDAYRVRILAAAEAAQPPIANRDRAAIWGAEGPVLDAIGSRYGVARDQAKVESTGAADQAAQWYRDQRVTAVRPAQSSDPGWSDGADQVWITLEGGSETIAPRAELVSK